MTGPFAPAAGGTATRAEPMGWPRSTLHGDPAFSDMLRRVLGDGLRWHAVREEGLAFDAICVRRLRPPSLACRFDLMPRDRGFVTGGERRVLPLRVISPPMSLEAGTLRGGIAASEGVDVPGAVLTRLMGMRGWDYAHWPVPLAEGAAWKAAAERLGLPAILRRTGRFFSGMAEVTGGADPLPGLSRNLRRTVTRGEKAMTEAGAVIRAWHGETLAEGIDRLATCAAESWKGRGETTQEVLVPFTETQSRILSEASEIAHLAPLVFTMEAPDGTVLGAQSWIRRGPVLTAGQTFHLGAARSLSPGHVLIAAALRSEVTRGVRSVDFNATATWVDGWSDARAEFATLLVMPRGPKGRALHALSLARDPEEAA